jgi:hypothetical protein
MTFFFPPQWDWGLNSGLRAILLKPHLQSILLWLFIYPGHGLCHPSFSTNMVAVGMGV